MEQEISRDKKGQFSFKSESPRKTRSLRATDRQWKLIQDKAESLNMSVGDYLEFVVLQDDDYQLERLKQKSVDIVFDDKIRGKDRGFVKRLFAELLDVETSYYPKYKKDYLKQRVMHGEDKQ